MPKGVSKNGRRCPDGYVDCHKVADACAVSVSTVNKWARNGDMPPPVMRIGRRNLWAAGVVDVLRRKFEARVCVGVSA